MDVAKALSVAAAASWRLAKDTAVLLRRYAWQIVLTLVAFSILGLLFRFWLGLVFLFPLVVTYVTLAPLVCLARPWRRVVEADAIAVPPDDTRATTAAIATWFLPRVLVLLLVWLGFIAILSLLWGVDLLMRGRLVCLESYRGWHPIPMDVAIELGASGCGDLSSVWCDFRLDGAVLYFLTTACYGAALIAFLSRKKRSLVATVSRYLIATVAMDNVFYGFDYFREPWARVNGIAADPVYDVSKVWVLLTYVSTWLSQTWLVWWYVLLKWCLTVLLVRLSAKSLGQTPLATTLTELPE